MLFSYFLCLLVPVLLVLSIFLSSDAAPSPSPTHCTVSHSKPVGSALPVLLPLPPNFLINCISCFDFLTSLHTPKS